MDSSSDEDSIIPILNQIKEYGTKKNKQCISLESALNTATAKNEELKKEIETLEILYAAGKDEIKQLDDERENLENTLIAARAKNEELVNEIQSLRKLQTTAEMEIEKRDKECEHLKSLLSTYDFKLKNLQRSSNTLNSHLKEVKEKNRNLELTLESAADMCASKCKELDQENKNLKIKTENLESSLKTSESKCSTLKLSLIEANNTMEQMNTRFNDLNSSFLAVEVEKAELITRCETLEKSLSTANDKIEQLKLELSESKKENTTNATLEKKEIIMATLKEVENKLTKNPLYPIIDRMQRNIKKLDEMAKNSTPHSEQMDEVEIFDVPSSDDDDRSTLSYTSDRPIDDVDLPGGSADHSQADVSTEETVLTMPASSSSADYGNVESTTRNDRVNVQIEDIDDSSCDSDISLSVCTNVSTNSKEEEPSYSTEKSSHLSQKSTSELLDSNQIAITVNASDSISQKSTSELLDSNQSVVIVKASDSTSDKKETEKRVSFENSVKLSEEKNQPECANVTKIDQHPIPEPILENLNYGKEISRLQEAVKGLIKKTSQNIKLLHPVVLLERCEDSDYDDRPDVGFDDSTESESESLPSVLKNQPENRNGPLIWTCNICKFNFLSSEDLKKHVEFRGHDKNATKCQFCGFNAKTIRTRRRHETHVHGVVHATAS